MKFKNIILPYILLIFTTYLCGENPLLINLEENSQDFVLEVIKIDIPGHPHAFNPSIIRWQGRLLMSFREVASSLLDDSSIFCGGPSRIGLVWLDESFSPSEPAQMLDTSLHQENHLDPIPFRAEDARLISIADRLYIVYSDNRERITTEGGYRMFFSELHIDENTFWMEHTECLTSFEGENKNRREKNWVPFDYFGNMMLAYSLLPHQILSPLIGTGKCETFASTCGEIEWPWGELRGGTPALEIDNIHYLAFFHSSKDMATIHSEGKMVPHYFIGAYTFSQESPFTITQISPEPIIGKGFYEGLKYTPYWKPIVAVFPCGYIFDDQFFWISYGRQDHEIWVVKIDRKSLLESLVPVKTK